MKGEKGYEAKKEITESLNSFINEKLERDPEERDQIIIGGKNYIFLNSIWYSRIAKIGL